MKLLLDLDGTLTDPGIGISRCIQHALSAMGRPAPAASELMRFVGPPLRDSFVELLGVGDGLLVDQAIAFYRERFSSVGLLENAVYPGIADGLARLRDMRNDLWLVTSKPTVYARRIVDHFGLSKYFSGIYGSELSGANADKVELVRYVLKAEQLEHQHTWMIGDRVQDIRAARENGLRSIGVLWGYGTREELEAAGADRVVMSIEELCAEVNSREHS